MRTKISLLLLSAILFTTQLFAQNPVDVSGVVYDPGNVTIPGANVFVKGDASKGTTTDIDGNFHINVPAGSTLVFSFIGYKDFEYNVTGPVSNLVVKFSDEGNAIDELVVVGYGIQKKSVLTSSVSRVTGDELDAGHPTSLDNALKGKLSGISVISNSGQPGAGSQVRIRGISTINDSNPLYIVDGMPTENGIDYLNPTDIESVEILKDAASAAIYGSRGANGVVLVTTKEGKKGPATVDYEFTYGIQNPARKVDLLKASEYVELINEMASNSGKSPYFTTAPKYDTDWQDVLKNSDAPIINHKASISGGGDNSNYYISFGYLSQEGIYAKGYSDYERYNFRAKYNTTVLDVKDRDWLNKIQLGTNFAYTQAKSKGTTIGNSEGSGIIASMNMLPPTEPVYQDDLSELARYATTFPNAVTSSDGRYYNIIDMREICNPLADLKVNHNQRYIPRNFTGSASLTANLWKGLVYKTTFGIDYMTTQTKKVVPVYQLNTTNYNATSYVNDSKSTGFNYQWDETLSYNVNFGKHAVGAMLGTSVSSYHSEYIGATDYDLLTVDINKAYIDTATASEENSVVSSSGADHKLASFFGRVNYNYDEKYLAEFVIRRDGSSNFGPKHQWGTFPSVSLGWVLTRESFMKDRPVWFDFMKLRASWGRNGNENIGAFKYTTMMASGHNAIIGGKSYAGMYPSGYANEDLKWETSEQLDFGTDIRLFNSALTFTFDWFKKKTKDMLLDKPIPLYTSFNSMTVNAGSVENKGFEFDVNYRFATGKFNWGVGANASYVQNEVSDQGPDMVGLNSLGGGMGGQVSFSQTGRPYGFFYGYKVDGVFQTDQEAAASGQNVGSAPHAGDLRFKDVTGDGKINADDRTMIGNPNPDWTYGFNLTAAWNNFDLAAYFQGAIGNDIYRLYRRSNVALANFDHKWMNRWHGVGTSNSVPRIVEGDNINYQISDFFVEDGSYLRFKTLQIGYTLPQTLTRKFFVKSLRLFVQGENLFTITGYNGYDPEVGTRSGLDGGTYPQARIFTAGVHIKF